ncbi:branched-chain amino acid transport system II carrier protein [Fructobacillus tropaeoli]|uniref:Branched-chain amino acid transport system carrier protein n=1 Tax=Fructobacillus tropaeoli TaxID=709323 RepID=A0ABM9MMZ5_9LACO|nr:branched-chain amino acid transport system II carrier protein [Fructobacillus tropaeoli]GIC70002.1 branched-chain amino acid transport system II carrier protein [Fructobacillus tropaeoli]CAK1227654.1 Branched-chain amino acid permease (BrnQ) [Fructobacillus tropaeoli]
MEKKLSWKQALLLFSLIFGMFFGSGNLIFPVHLGQIAGAQWGPATVGFLLSAVILPLLSLVALAVTRSESVFDLIRPLGHRPATIFLVALQLCLGPIIVAPRTATVAYSFSFANWLPKGQQQIGLIVFALIYFILVYWSSTQSTKLLDIIGRYLNPIFLAMLAFIFILAIISPMGSTHQAVTTAYQGNAIAPAFIEGYNTVDAMAGLIFGVTIVHSIQKLGYKKPGEIATVIVKTGTLSMVVLAVVYVGLILLGTTSLAHMPISSNGAVALTNVMLYYFGRFGQIFIAVMGTLAVFTTAMGLTASFARDLNRVWPKVSYKGWLAFASLLAFIVATLGLDKIIVWAAPILMFLYPIAIVLILLSLLSPWLGQGRFLYGWALGLTLIAAVFDGLSNAPFAKDLGGLVSYTVGTTTHVGWYQTHIFGASAGFGWIGFAFFGIVIGLICQKLFGTKTKS